MQDDVPNDDDEAQDEDAPMPYEETTEDGYAEHVAKRFAVSRAVGAIVLTGACPRCRHSMEYLLGEALKRPQITSTSREPMICTCASDHPKRPEGYRGCGAYWDVIVNLTW